MKKPRKLKYNDYVGIVAPSQAAKAESVERAVNTVRTLGLNPVVYHSCFLTEDGRDVAPQKRAMDINTAFADDLIMGIITLRAGSGTLLTLENLAPFGRAFSSLLSPHTYTGNSDNCIPTGDVSGGAKMLEY